MPNTDEDPRDLAFAEAIADKYIDLAPGQTSSLIDLVLYKISHKPATEIFQTNGLLSRIVEVRESAKHKNISREKISRLVVPHSPDSLADALSSYEINFRKYDMRRQEWKLCDPTNSFLQSLLERKRYPNIPFLRGVIEAPVLKPDGTVQKEPGYDPLTGLFLVNEGINWASSIPEKATYDDAKAAIGRLRATFASLPFETEADESVYLATVLLPFVRYQLPAAPATVVSAAASGVGKTLACDCVAILFQGHRPAVISIGNDDEEIRKQLFSILLLKDRIVIFDNVERTLSGDFLCSLLTSDHVRGRLLGGNTVINVGTDIVVLINGNNVITKGDLSNRVLQCRLKVDRERPEEREFDFDLRKAIIDKRRDLVSDCLSLFIAWYQSGREHQDVTPFGRFESWSRCIREMLVWLELEDPYAKHSETLLQDPEAAGLESLLTAWYEVYKDSYVTTQKMLKDLNAEYLMEDQQKLNDALIEIAGDHDKVNRHRFGKYLSRYQDRMINGFAIQQGPIAGGVRKWRVKLSS